MDLGFRQGAGDAEDGAFVIATIHADGDEGGAVAHDAIDANLVVGGVDGEVAHFFKGAVAPFFKFSVELFVEVRDLAGGDFEAAEFFDDFGDPARADALDIHGGDGGFEGAVAA